ncbi:MAG TPA: hypothetical protein VN651_10680 [Gemmatimonadaceae bacterium]|nr:hypothetical protein [Gemmatimonadaceae bacterium]
MKRERRARGIQDHLSWTSFSDAWRQVEALKDLFAVAARRNESNPEEIGRLRKSLLKTSNSTFIELMKVLSTEDYCSAPDD